MACVLAVDVGTSSLRAELFDEEGQPLREVVRQRYEPGPELDPEPLVTAIRDAIATAGAVDAVAYSCLWHSLIALDERNRPLTPVFTWLDRGAAEDAVALAREVDGVAAHARTGAPIHPSFWPAQIRRLRRHDVPFARVATFPDYLRWRIEGELATTTSIASGSGLFRVRDLCWDDELLAAVGVDEAQVPPVRDDVVMIGDGAAANVGSGCFGPARACVSIGTSGALRVVRGEVRPLPGLFLYRLDRDRYVQGGALSDGGNLLVWLARFLGVTVGDALDREPGSVVLLPQLGGERSLGWRPDATGAISGLTFATTPETVVQAAFEGISYRFRDILDTLAWPSQPSELGQANHLSRSENQIREVVATGAALLARPGWAQLLADVLEVPVIFSAVAEASARGAALVAVGRMDAPAPLGERFVARPERAEAHQAARERLRLLYEATAAPTS